jgi:hypothetical protein
MRRTTIVLAILLIAVLAPMATKSWMIQAFAPPLRAHSIPQTAAPLVPARPKFARP